MIGVVYGTTGELIKIAPLLRSLAATGQPAFTMTTAQQVEQLPAFLEDLGLPPADVHLARGAGGRDLRTKAQIPGWGARVGTSVIRRHRPLSARLRSDGRPPVVLVHGDTMTTLLGALIGRSLGATVGHVEAGLRSGDWRNPFPEEINRRAAARVATLHFAPGAKAVENLRREGVPGRIVDTRENTVKDALALAAATDPGIPVPAEPFGLVSLHRFELIERPEAFAAILDILRAHSQRQPLLFIDHSTTAAAIAAHRFERYFDDSFRRVPRLRHAPFVSLLRRSDFLVTDSGGSQEECFFLGHPCFVHRAVTERDEGLGANVVLSGMRLEALSDFLAAPSRYRLAPQSSKTSPTAIIHEELARMGATAPLPSEDGT